MQRTDFHYELPPGLIAQHPLAERSASRLLCLEGDTGAIEDRRFSDLPALLRPGDFLVLNDTRVIPARLFGVKPTGGKVEVLVERILDDHRVLAHIRASKPLKPGARVDIEGGISGLIEGRQAELYVLVFESPRPVTELLDEVGRIPLPPYITRPAEKQDSERYQTVFARHPGAVAAPTAGLHFDASLLRQLQNMGVEIGYVTLHVGAGTFQPVRADRIQDHRMHFEYVEVGAEICARIHAARERGGRVIAVGTTVVRSLETAARQGELVPYQGETDIFIYPGFRFQCVDAMITNFHLPESTLLMLVCAFAGYEHVMHAYRHAVAERYRFFSYGDAMFITASRDHFSTKARSIT